MTTWCVFLVYGRYNVDDGCQFPSVLLGMLGSTIPVSLIGIRFAMGVEPFWKPNQYSTCTLAMLFTGTSTAYSPRCRNVVREYHIRHSRISNIRAEGDIVGCLGWNCLYPLIVS